MEPIKVKVVRHTLVYMGVPVREDIYPGPSAYEIGLLAPLITAVISPMLPPGTHLQQDAQ